MLLYENWLEMLTMKISHAIKYIYIIYICIICSYCNYLMFFSFLQSVWVRAEYCCCELCDRSRVSSRPPAGSRWRATSAGPPAYRLSRLSWPLKGQWAWDCLHFPGHSFFAYPLGMVSTRILFHLGKTKLTNCFKNFLFFGKYFRYPEKFWVFGQNYCKNWNFC